MFDKKLKQLLTKAQGKKELMRVIEKVEKGNDGLILAFDAKTGEVMSTIRGLCHHEVEMLLSGFAEQVRQNDLEHIQKETQEELELLERHKEKPKN